MRQFQLSRRSAFRTAIALAGAPALGAIPGQRKRIALIGTEVRTHSHAQHFLDRHAAGYAWEGKWRQPEVDLVSLYIDQFPDGDLARERSKKFGIPIYPSVEEALTLGGSKLAVDGVIIIGEHGQYPRNEKGQTLYPRFKFFKQTVGIFEASGYSVPVFNDKHLSTDWDQCVEMVEDSRRLGFPFLAGSSLPVTRRLPAIDLPYGTPLVESVCVCYGGVDSYDFHGLETAQCMSERRRGGEVGIRSVHALRDQGMWDYLAKHERTQELFLAALCRSHNLPVVEGYPSAPITMEWAREAMPQGIAYFIEHLDGFRTTMLLMPIRDFNYAGMTEAGDIISCQMYLPMPGHGSTTADFFHPLVNHIERMILTNKAPYPVERTLLTSGMTLAAVDSLFKKIQIETPSMGIRYNAPRESTYWTV